jgi:hypothetical protein
VTLRALTIDCGWLKSLEEPSSQTFGRLRLMFRLEDGDQLLLLDHEGRIAAEYARNLIADATAAVMVAQFFMAGRVEYRSGRPTGACTDRLDRDGFDPSDRPYVGVAQAAKGAYLTHETDKHLRPERVDLLRDHCGVTVGDETTIGTLL